jgi:hypothetical protein
LNHRLKSTPPEPPANPDRLRQRIDRGKGADKVDFPDPAAAPLGTDDEAAGTPITQEQLQMAMAHETRPGGGPAAVRSGPQANTRSNARFVLLLVLAGALVIAVTALLVA